MRFNLHNDGVVEILQEHDIAMRKMRVRTRLRLPDISYDKAAYADYPDRLGPVTTETVRVVAKTLIDLFSDAMNVEVNNAQGD